MRRKRIAVLMASIDREYQQEFAAALVSAGQKNDADICIFNSQGHMNVAISTSETGESMIYDLPDDRWSSAGSPLNSRENLKVYR